jgi:hypothetical protein
VLALLAEVTRAWEAAAVAEAAGVTVVLAAETSAQEVAVARDNTALRVKDTEDWATLAEREALERVSSVETEITTALASTCEDAEGFIRKIALLEGELEAEHQA